MIDQDGHLVRAIRCLAPLQLAPKSLGVVTLVSLQEEAECNEEGTSDNEENSGCATCAETGLRSQLGYCG